MQRGVVDSRVHFRAPEKAINVMDRSFRKTVAQNRRLWKVCFSLVAVALLSGALTQSATAQDQDDPPGRAARLGFMEGSVSFQPAGENEWVGAAPNRPMTTGDKLWVDRDSRTGVQLGSTSIHLNSNTGISFLNLDDRTTQIQLSSGSMSVRVRHLERDEVFEIDTPNQAFTIFRPGQYRVEASEDGSNTVVTVRQGQGESTGNGQTYTVHEGQRATFSGTDRLNADVEQVGAPDSFDEWSDGRDRRFDDSRSARYVSPEVVGSQDLDEYGDWQPSPEYGNVWFPRVDAGWAPYHTGHWAWIDPWGWTWVDDAPWGYAPFHYGRWVNVYGRWGWVPGPREVRPVYAPALVVFVGGGGPAMGGNVAWFPLGPREVYVPPYHVSPTYVNQVNVSNTTVNQTTVTNVYNTTVINNNTTVNNTNINNTRVNNVTYVNRNVNGAVTAVPQQAFAGGQAVSRVAVPVSRQQLEAAPVTARVAVAPTPTAVTGPRAGANRVAAPPQAVFTRPVIAKAAPPPPPVSFAAKQQVLAAHPGQPVARQEMQRLRPAVAPASQPVVRQAPPGKPATPTTGHPGNQPATNQPANRPMLQPVNEHGNPPAVNNRPEPNRPIEPPAKNDRPASAQPNNRPEPNQPVPNNRPAENNRPMNQPQPNNRPEPQPAPNNRPAENNRPMNQPQPNNRPEPQPAPNNRPAENNRPMNQPQPNNHPAPQPSPNNRPAENNRPMNQPQPNNHPAPQPAPNNRPAEPGPRNDRPPAAQPNNHPAPQAAPNHQAPPPPANNKPKDEKKPQ